MTRISVTRTSEVRRTGRLSVAASSMDHPDTGATTTTIEVDLPVEDKPWTVGLIVGPSGAGKTTVAREMWPDSFTDSDPWPADRAIVDAFPEEMTASQVTDTLARVGLGSVPAWIRPYHHLSNGEQFRAQMARTLATADRGRPVVVDEFTSVVDRQVAQVVSHTVQKWCRKADQRFVAVSCHYDIEDWLQPDWLLDMASGAFTWRSVQPRPRIDLNIHPVPLDAWRLFRAHHYLSSNLHRAAHCFVAFHATSGAPVAFTSYLHMPHSRTRNIKMGHRLVVLPDWQGLGIARALETWLGDYLAERGYRYRNAVAHPAMKHLYATSPRWRLANARINFANLRSASKIAAGRHRTIRQAGLLSFEYQPPRKDT